MSDFIRQAISVGNLLLDVGNYRNSKQNSQKAERDAIIEDQGKKLIVLAKDILTIGLNPIDIPMVIDAEDGQQNYTIVEGNRRLTTIQLMLNPELAQGTEVYVAFKKLNSTHADAIPKVIECVIAPSKKSALVWINRKHGSKLEGAGTEPWNSIAKARAEVEQGFPRPDLDVVNFVLTNSSLDDNLRHHLEGSDFNITSLKRLVETKEVPGASGFQLEEGRLISEQNKDRLRDILTDVIKVIATGKDLSGKKFTEREIDTPDKRAEFIEKIVKKHPRAKKEAEPWRISGTPINVKKKQAKKRTRSTPSTDQQQNLIPKSFKLELPAGKINDVFVELKRLDATIYRHAVSVLFRVFVEFSLDEYIKKHGIPMPLDHKGRPKDSLPVRLEAVKAHVKQGKVMSDKELKPFNVALSAGSDSLIAPDTLNAYVHSRWLNPDPRDLKLSWANLQLFIERLWTSENKAGQPD